MMTAASKMSTTTTTIAFAGSEMDTATNHSTHASPAKSRKSFGISRKASAIRLAGSHHEKHSSPLSQEPITNNNNMPITPKEKKSSSSGFLSYFFKPFRSQKTTPTKKIPHTTALEQTEFASSSSRKDSKFETDLAVPKIPSLPSTPHVSRFSQALFVPPMESSAPSSQHSVSRSSSDSPCLFAAFEQAIKSGVLVAPLVPPELILKYQQESETRGDRRSRFVRKGSLSRSLEITWTQKLFILTSGLLIQYGSDGPYDREPERVLKLRPESLTFVTDVLDGKPFVLQITSGGIDVPPLTLDERRPSIISRAVPKARFDAHVIFLVFENAEDMQEWMTKIRKEISRLGGPSIEEHPGSSSKAGTIVEEEDPRSRTPRRSMDSSRKNSRKSDEIATSASTAMSQEGLLLDGLRTSNNSVSSQRRGSQVSLNTSPERCSVPDIFDKRYSTISTAHSYSSTDLRLKSRPVSTTLGTEHTASERPPSPTLTQVSTSSFGRRRSRGNLPAPIPIPVPSIPKRYSTAGSSIGNLPSPVEIAHRRARRSRKSSAPPSPDKVIQLLSTSLPNPKSPPPAPIHKIRPRPVSLAAAPVTQRKDKSQNRRSVGSLSSSASAHGPPLHPPPSVPLPRLPDGTPGNLPKLPFGLLSPYQQGVPPVPQIPIPIPHSPLALHSQSASDISPVGRKQSIASLSRA